VISVHILCLDDCFLTTIMSQPTEITQFIFGRPLRENSRSEALSAERDPVAALEVFQPAHR
jgi:hypothetical protein